MGTDSSGCRGTGRVALLRVRACVRVGSCTHMQMIWGKAESLLERSSKGGGGKRQRHAKY